jgi:hypothetical protein
MNTPESPRRNPSADASPAQDHELLPKWTENVDERGFITGVAATLLLPSRVFAFFRRILWRLLHPFSRPLVKPPARRSGARRNTFKLSHKTTHHYAK